MSNMGTRITITCGAATALLYVFLANADAHAASSEAAANAPAAKFFSLSGQPTKAGKIYRMPESSKAKFASYPLAQRHNMAQYAAGKTVSPRSAAAPDTISGDASQAILALFDEDPAAGLHE